MAVNRSPLLQPRGRTPAAHQGGPRGRPGISASRALRVATRERCALPLTRNRRVLAGMLAAIGSDGEVRPTRADREEFPACRHSVSGCRSTLGSEAIAHPSRGLWWSGGPWVSTGALPHV